MIGSESKLRRRFAIWLPVMAIFSAMLAVNLWVYAKPARVDLTTGDVFSISPATRLVIETLKEPVRITYFFDIRNKSFTDAMALLEQYAALSPLITVEGFDPTPIGRRLFARQAFARYAQKYSASGDTRIREPGRDLVLVDRDFEITDEIVDDFMQFLAQERLTIDAGELSDDALFVRAMIRYYIDLDLFGVLDARRHLVEVDPQAMFALTLFGKAEALTRLSRPGQPVEP